MYFISRRISDRRKKARSFKRVGTRRRCNVAFTTKEIFTYILQGWVQEFIELGADERLHDIVFSIYAR